MAITTKGRVTDFYADGVAIQPNFSLTEKNDGSIEGQVVFKCDESRFSNLPQMDSGHPRDSRCELYNREITYLPLGQIQLTGSYFGLVANKTKPIISYTPNTDRDPVTAHPDFSTALVTAGGVWRDSNNGQLFTEAERLQLPEDNDKALEFFGWTNPEDELFGVEFYLTPSTMVSLTYWQKNVPTIRKRMKIVNRVPGFRKPADVKDFLLLDFPYRQVGNFYQVTELYLGSGPKGFSKLLYP